MKPQIGLPASPGPGWALYSYLLRNLAIERPEHAWSTDITHVPMACGFVYLTAVMNWFSRYLLAWRLSLTLDAAFCVEVLAAALAVATPGIFNTDQGSQFSSSAFTGRLAETGFVISMDGRGRALHNVFVERLWRSLKCEEIYPRSYKAVWEDEAGIGAWSDFYNHKRLHMALDGRVPTEVHADKSPSRPPNGGRRQTARQWRDGVRKYLRKEALGSKVHTFGSRPATQTKTVTGMANILPPGERSPAGLC